MGCTPAQTVMVGDQIFTDTLGANNAGVTPLLVEPIQLAGNPGRYLRYAAETPFRLLGKGGPSYECQIRARRQQRRFLRRPQVLPWPPPSGSRSRGWTATNINAARGSMWGRTPPGG